MTRIYWPGMVEPGNPDDLPVLGDDQVAAVLTIRHELMGMHLDTTGSVLVGAEVGSGKTVTIAEAILATVDAIRARDLSEPRVLIVGPRDVYGQWAEAIQDQIANYEGAPEFDYHLRRIDSSKPGKRHLSDLLSGEPGLYYCGLEYLRAKDWEQYVDDNGKKQTRQTGTYRSMKMLDLIVSDEAHRHSNRATAALKTMRSIPAARKVALSGTFFGNKFENAHTVTRWLWPEVQRPDGVGWLIDPSIRLWQNRWCRIEQVKSKAGRTVRNPRTRQPLTRVVSERNPGEFVKTLPCYVYLDNPIGDAPPSDVVQVKMTGHQERQYDEMERKSLAWLELETGERHPLVADLPIVQRARLRTAALGEMKVLEIEGKPEPEVGDEFFDDGDESGPRFRVTFDAGSKSNKLTALYALLHGEMPGHADWGGQKALILTHSAQFAHEVARRIRQRYPDQVVTKTGADSAKDWDEAKRRFRLPPEHPDSAQWLVATIPAVGTGTDGLQHRCSRVVWLSVADSTVENVQATARIWRRGVKVEEYSSVEIQSVRADGGATIDREVREVTAQKGSNMSKSIRGRVDDE